MPQNKQNQLQLSWKQISYYLLDALNYNIETPVTMDEFFSTIDEKEIPQSFKDEVNSSLDCLEDRGLVETVKPGRIVEGQHGVRVEEEIIRIRNK